MQALEDCLGYRFRQPALVQQALTHTSAASSHAVLSNERLEFLGDRVLGIVIAEWLYEAFPHESEGALAKRHARLVSRETLAVVADALQLHNHLHVAPNDAVLRQARARGVLADAVEALLAALYLDGGLAPVQACVRRFWAPLLRAGDAPPQDAKSALQEWAQARGLPAPVYVEKGRSGPAHRPEFTMVVQLEGWPQIAATGASKKQAEQAAAQALLAQVVAG